MITVHFNAKQTRRYTSPLRCGLTWIFGLIATSVIASPATAPSQQTASFEGCTTDGPLQSTDPELMQSVSNPAMATRLSLESLQTPPVLQLEARPEVAVDPEVLSLQQQAAGKLHAWDRQANPHDPVDHQSRHLYKAMLLQDPANEPTGAAPRK